MANDGLYRAIAAWKLKTFWKDKPARDLGTRLAETADISTDDKLSKLASLAEGSDQWQKLKAEAGFAETKLRTLDDSLFIAVAPEDGQQEFEFALGNVIALNEQATSALRQANGQFFETTGFNLAPSRADVQDEETGTTQPELRVNMGGTWITETGEEKKSLLGSRNSRGLPDAIFTLLHTERRKAIDATELLASTEGAAVITKIEGQKLFGPSFTRDISLLGTAILAGLQINIARTMMAVGRIVTHDRHADGIILALNEARKAVKEEALTDWWMRVDPGTVKTFGEKLRDLVEDALQKGWDRTKLETELENHADLVGIEAADVKKAKGEFDRLPLSADKLNEKIMAQLPRDSALVRGYGPDAKLLEIVERALSSGTSDSQLKAELDQALQSYEAAPGLLDWATGWNNDLEGDVKEAEAEWGEVTGTLAQISGEIGFALLIAPAGVTAGLTITGAAAYGKTGNVVDAGQAIAIDRAAKLLRIVSQGVGKTVLSEQFRKRITDAVEKLKDSKTLTAAGETLVIDTKQLIKILNDDLSPAAIVAIEKGIEKGLGTIGEKDGQGSGQFGAN